MRLEQEAQRAWYMYVKVGCCLFVKFCDVVRFRVLIVASIGERALVTHASAR